MIFNFFKTAPVMKSDNFLKLERIGKISLLVEAIEAERKNPNSNTGTSLNGQVVVQRVGAFGNKRGR